MESNNKLPFEKRNYIFMLIGVGILILGFAIMTMDTEPYGFGTLGITIGPIVVMLGFVVQFFAIFAKTKEK